MSHFNVRSSFYKREWVKQLPDSYKSDWVEKGLLQPPTDKQGKVARGVPFYAAPQLYRLDRVPRQLRGATKPLVITTTKIGEPYYTPQLDFDLRLTVRPLSLKYNNLLDPHLKHFFKNPEKKKVLVKRGLVTPQGDVICHSLKELNQYRELLYWSYGEMLQNLRKDVGSYMPRILNKRKAIAEITSEQRRYSLLKQHNKKLQKKFKKVKETHYEYRKEHNLLKTSSRSSPKKEQVIKTKTEPQSPTSAAIRRTDSQQDSARQSVTFQLSPLESKAIKKMPQEPEKTSAKLTSTRKNLLEKQNLAATKIQALFKGYLTRKRIASKYKKGLKKQMKHKYGDSLMHKKIWDRTKQDNISTCHTHSCTERLAQQFEITDIPNMMRLLKDPVAQQAYRKHFLLRLMHTPTMEISGTLVAPLLREEIKHHSAKFRWV